jgi:energy-coupling factor transporter ATP-binding protein EcfA2
MTEPIRTEKLSFIYESVYKLNREEINAIIRQQDGSTKDDPKLAPFKALNSITLKISKGEFIGLLGATGSGKSTLVRTFNGLIPSFYRGIFFGYVGVHEKDTINEKISNLSQHVGLVFQNPENQLVAMTVEREIAFGLENLGIDRDIIQQKITEILEYLDIIHLRKRHPYELSGGEQQRVAIASILVLEPDLIILDEPTASLDPQATVLVLNLLQKLNCEKKITIIVIEHRLDVILPYCSQLMVIDNGKLVLHDDTQAVLASTAFYETNIRIPKFIHFYKNLKDRDLYSGKLPTSVIDAAKILKELNIR